MKTIKVGDSVEVTGDTQDYILTDPERKYRGEVIGKDGGNLLVRLEEPVMRGPGQFREATVHETRARTIPTKN